MNGPEPKRGLLRRSELRVTIVVVVLAVAGIVALWPRATAVPGGAPSGAVPQLLDNGPRTAPAPDDAELAEPRSRAALQPCPTARPGSPPAAGPLAGVTLPCLGAPGTVDLAAALAGRPALLNVWASWCGPCREEIPVLASYAGQPGAVAVIGINVQDRPADALELLTALGARYPSVTDPRAELLASLRSPPVLPTSYILRPDGSVSLVTPPVVFRSPQQVTDVVRRQLGTSG